MRVGSKIARIRCGQAPTRFNRWLLRALLGQQLEYHRGQLIWDGSPASALAEGERRALARVADAALQAADDGVVHLVQRRNGELDFSYLAIKAARTAEPAACGAASLPLVRPRRARAMRCLGAPTPHAGSSREYDTRILGE